MRPLILFRSAVQTATFQVLIVAVSIITSVVVARVLGPVDRGVLAIIIFWPTLLSNILLISINEAVVFQQPRSQTGVRVFRTTAMLIVLALVFLAIPVGLLILPFLVPDTASDQIWIIETLLLLMIPVHFFATALLAFDLASKNLTRYNSLRVMPSAIYLVGVLYLVQSDNVSIQNIVVAFWISLVASLLLRTLLSRYQFGWPPSRRDAIILMKSALKFHPSSVLTMIGSQSDRLLVVSLLPAEQIAYYFIALTVVTSAFGVLSGSLGTVMFPEISGRLEKEVATASLSRLLRRSTLAVVVSVLPIAVASYLLIPSLFGENFAEAAVLGPIMALAAGPFCIRQIAVRCARGLDDGQMGVGAEATAMIVLALLAYPAIKLGSVMGLAVATIVAHTAAIFYVALRLKHKHSISAREWLFPNRDMILDVRQVIINMKQLAGFSL